MTRYEILIGIKAYSLKNGQAPNSSDKQMCKFAREAHRKIGSWTKTLWLAGAIKDRRKKRLPQFNIIRDEKGLLSMDSKSLILFKKYCNHDPNLKPHLTC